MPPNFDNSAVTDLGDKGFKGVHPKRSLDQIT